MIVCVNGKFFPRNKAKISALDNGFLYGDGVYETMRVYDGVVFEFDQHLARLQKSTNAIGLKIVWPLAKIREWTYKIIKSNRLKSARARITVSRGENGPDFNSCKNPTLVINAQKLILDPKIYRDGMAAVTLRLQRILPEIKTVGLTHMIQGYRAMDLSKVEEGIIVDKKDFVREGLATNVFVVRNGVIWTPKTGILMGTTRGLVIKLARDNHVKVVEKDFKIGELLKADEIFVTNRPKEIMPVTKLNGKKVGNGKVGEITKRMMKAYRGFVEEYVRRVNI